MAVRSSALMFVGSAGLLTVTAVLLPAMANGAAQDTDPPVVTLSSAFAVGQQVGPSNLLNDGDDGCAETDNTTTVPFDVTWSATDASGIADYNEWRTFAGQTPEFLGWWSDGDGSTAFVDALDDYKGDCGGGSLEADGWAITAYDLEDNASYVETGREPRVFQENGTSAWDGDLDITLGGTWHTSRCNCASGGQQAFTKHEGANAVVRFAGDRVGLVMATGPNRGALRVRIDGQVVATVHTNASTTRNRVIVWQSSLDPGEHVLRIRNLATHGHPRIDLDAVLL